MWRSVTHMCHISFRSHRLLFSHASTEVRSENTPEIFFPSTGFRTHNHQAMSPTRSPQPPGRSTKLWDKTVYGQAGKTKVSRSAQADISRYFLQKHLAPCFQGNDDGLIRENSNCLFFDALVVELFSHQKSDLVTHFLLLTHWLTVTWKKYCAEYWKKDTQESMDRLTGHCDVTEITLKMALTHSLIPHFELFSSMCLNENV